jgi:preprotein translocase subunit SecY
MNALMLAAFALAVVVGVVLVNEGTRNIAIEYGRTGVRTQKVSNYLPLKINQAGVIPIIFALSVVMLPSMLSGPFQASDNTFFRELGFTLATSFSQQSVGYNVFYFLLVVAFTYFYTSVQFNPKKIAEDVKKRGGFIPGVRPGKSTETFLKSIMNRITLAGAVFLGLIAVLPFVIQSIVGLSVISVGGTGLLIVVSVVLETIRQVESLMVQKNYDRFLR